MRLLMLALAMVCAGFAARAEGERAGEFDYYVMSLGWSANWCALEGDGRADPQCGAGLGLTFTLHGLWPQNDYGWPSYCRTAERDPTRNESAVMADIMGGSGLAWYQWKKHGRCAGLSATGYYSTMRRAYGSIVIPDVFSRLHKDITLPASVVEDAFLDANPGLSPDGVVVTCDRGMIQEVRICLTKDLSPRACGADVARSCQGTALMDAVR